MNALVGRAKPLGLLRRYLDDEQRALVTITGVAGMGKTTLAQHYLQGLGDRDGRLVTVVDAAACTTADEFDLAVCLAMGIENVKALVPALASDPRLLVLDNLEHMVETVRTRLLVWVSEVPELQVLATSRIPLGVPIEHVLELGPLARPTTEDDLASCASGELFMRQARRHCATFSFAEAERPALVELLAGLDGLPLAIELAAARADLLSVSEMNDRLKQRFSLLATTDQPMGRHMSLHGALAETWSSLTPIERAVLAQCTVFEGGFTVQAAEAVVDLEAADASCLDLMQVLRRRSLLTRERRPTGHMRLDMLMSVREFAQEHLTPSERREAQRRHGKWAAGVASSIPRELRASTSDGLTSLLEELRNLYAAADRALDDGEPAELETGLAIIGPLAHVARALGQREPVRRRLERLLELDGSETLPPGPKSAAVVFVGWERARDGSPHTGEEWAAQAVRLAEASGSVEHVANANRFFAAELAGGGKLAAAAEHLERVLTQADVQASAWPRAVLCDELADVYRQTGRLDEARRRGEEALTLLDDPADVVDCVNVLVGLTFIHIDQGDLNLAARRAARGLALCEDFKGGVTRLETALRLATARLDHAHGRLQDALSGYRSVMQVTRALDLRLMHSLAAMSAGSVLAELGHLAEASERYREALPIIDRAQAGLASVGKALLAGLESQRGHLAEGDALLAEARAECVQGPLMLIVNAGEALVDAGRARHSRDPALVAQLRDKLSAELLAIEELAESCPGPMRLELGLIARLLRARGIDAPSDAPDAPRLLVDEDGRWFEPPSGARIRVHRRPIMRRMLVTLAQSRVRDPGRALSAEELLAAGWPDERILPSAAKRRLQVMVTRMRDLGLRGVLQTTSDGYRIDPACVVRFEHAPP